jgi:hypothetical protein
MLDRSTAKSVRRRACILAGIDFLNVLYLGSTNTRNASQRGFNFTLKSTLISRFRAIGCQSTWWKNGLTLANLHIGPQGSVYERGNIHPDYQHSEPRNDPESTPAASRSPGNLLFVFANRVRACGFNLSSLTAMPNCKTSSN